MNSESQQITRRGFVIGALSLVGAGDFMTSHTAWGASVRGANENIRLAVIGLRKKGKHHIEIFRRLHGVHLVALCDCDRQFLDLEIDEFKKRGEHVKSYIDYRKVLDDKDVDAVVVVTPDHWHALMTVWA